MFCSKPCFGSYRVHCFGLSRKRPAGQAAFFRRANPSGYQHFAPYRNQEHLSKKRLFQMDQNFRGSERAIITRTLLSGYNGRPADGGLRTTLHRFQGHFCATPTFYFDCRSCLFDLVFAVGEPILVTNRIETRFDHGFRRSG